MPPSSSRPPFFPPHSTRGQLRVDRSREPMHHEVLFEDRYMALPGRRVFVGTGLPSSRLVIAFGFTALLLALLLGRAAWMQIVQRGTYAAQAEDNRIRHEVLPARRGIIRDRTGAILAENVPAFHVSMRWSDLPYGSQAREQTIATVARMVGVPTQDILQNLTATGTRADEWIAVARDVPYDRALALEVKMPELSGVSLVIGAKRHYPESATTPSLSHVLGYVGLVSPSEYADHRDEGYRRNDEIGKTGVELSHEDAIRGDAGERRTEVDAFGRPRIIVGDRAPVDGEDVMLTLDLELQRAAEVALKKGMERAKVGRGSAILMDAKDGSLRVLASLPAYDGNLFAGSVSSTAYAALLADENHPLFPRAWAGQFPAGSTIKPLIASAALAEGVITQNTTVLSVGGIHVGPWFFPDWKAGGHGRVTVRAAIAWSVNTFFYTIGGGYGDFIGLGVGRLTTWMRNFGLGAPTGIDLPGEASGHVPSEEWKQATKGERWYIGDTYNLSIGQGDLLVTPLQMARITATVANGGTLVIPHVLQGATSTDALRLKIDPSLLATVRQGMRETVAYGSGRALSILPFQAAGKTGTAQWRSDKLTHAWFIGYAPAENPEIVVVVLLEEGGEGSSTAVPVAGELLRAWWIQQHPGAIVPSFSYVIPRPTTSTTPTVVIPDAASPAPVAPSPPTE